ncbi:MAG TPA: hypothetical protein VGR19_05805 [Allosphingosinicella sp.]|nr:hypothetical protein [Allosphingosinicella sp.]
MTRERAKDPSPFLRAFAPSRDKERVRAKPQRREEEGDAFFAIQVAKVGASFATMRLPLPRLSLYAAAVCNQPVFFTPGGVKLMKLPAPQMAVGAL